MSYQDKYIQLQSSMDDNGTLEQNVRRIGDFRSTRITQLWELLFFHRPRSIEIVFFCWYDFYTNVRNIRFWNKLYGYTVRSERTLFSQFKHSFWLKINSNQFSTIYERNGARRIPIVIVVFYGPSLQLIDESYTCVLNELLYVRYTPPSRPIDPSHIIHCTFFRLIRTTLNKNEGWRKG